jgi:two-component system nitrogen regulation response regulator GlnG
MIHQRVLVIDNEEDQLAIMREIIENAGYQVTTVDNVSEALRWVEEGQFDLVLTDLIMPDMEGTELCERIKSIRSDIIVYAFSGHLKLYDMHKLERAGFSGYIAKPVGIKEVEQAIEDAFALARENRQRQEIP